MSGFSHRFTVIPDNGMTVLHCSACPDGSTWEIGYHPSLDVVIEQARAHNAEMHADAEADEWEPTGWWRVVRDIPAPKLADIRCESSDEGENRRALKTAPYPARLERRVRRRAARQPERPDVTITEEKWEKITDGHDAGTGEVQ